MMRWYMQKVIDIYRRRGIPVLIDSKARPDRRGCSIEMVTWRYGDGSQKFGSFSDFEEERDLAVTMQAAKGNPLAEAYYARIGHTLKEIPIERAAKRELLYKARTVRVRQMPCGSS